MRIIPEYIDTEINILIVKILFLTNIAYQDPYIAVLQIFSLLASIASLYINISEFGNHVSPSQKLTLRCSLIISALSIAITSINIYLNNLTHLLILFSTFSLIYNFITCKGYRRYLSPFLRTSNSVKSKYTEVINTIGTLSCSICMDSNTDIKFIMTSCGHHFHKECIEPWINVNSSCPNCRKII
jgi:hypothetical protein